MRLGNNEYWITKSRRENGTYYSNVFTKEWEPVPDEHVAACEDLIGVFKNKNYSDDFKNTYLKNLLSSLGQETTEGANGEVVNKPVFDLKQLTEIMKNLINFFSEFGFEPNFRFVNTLSLTAKGGRKSIEEYVFNYFELAGNDYAYSIRDKMKSSEWIQIADYLASNTTTKVINKRFKVYYGSQGTGKTTKAMEESENNVMVCHSAMLPSDLMEDFKFVEGKADFQPSALQIAMVEGKKIVLDEINLLPFESLRFLQSILDGKSEFVYKGKTIKIKEGFQIIGTMNLVVNGATYSLPEPLIDRASDLQKFKLSPENLVGAFC